MSSTAKDNWNIPAAPYVPTSPEPGVLLSTSPYEFQNGMMRFGIGEVVPPFSIDQSFQRLMFSTNSLRVETRQYHQQWSEGAVVLYRCINSLTEKVNTLMAEMETLRNTKTYAVPLSTLAPEPFEMMKPIFVTIHGEGENFTASFTEANISASGETAADAIANFKESLASRFEILQSKPATELGTVPARQWGILQSVVKPIE